MPPNALIPYFVKSKKDYSFHRTFGAVTTEIPDFNNDVGLEMEDQGGTPFCADYTVNGVRGNEDKKIYAKGFIYKEVLKLFGLPPTQQGIGLKDAFAIANTVGVLPAEYAPVTWEKDGQLKVADYHYWPDSLYDISKNNKDDAYYFLDGPYDHFDNARSAMWLSREANQNRTIGVGTPWYYEYMNVKKDGILPEGKKIGSWHAHEVCGQKTINGEPHLIDKSHQGKRVGDDGFLYLKRAEFNKMMDEPGAIGLLFCKKAQDNQTIQLSILQQIVGLYYQLIFKTKQLFSPSN